MLNPIKRLISYSKILSEQVLSWGKLAMVLFLLTLIVLNWFTDLVTALTNLAACTLAGLTLDLWSCSLIFDPSSASARARRCARAAEGC